MNLNRIRAVVLRHIFLAIHQLDRIADLFIFPIFAVFLWGFFSNYTGISNLGIISFLMGGLILWIIYERVGTTIGVDFMYDIWERTIMNFLASPITIAEYISGVVVISLLKIIVSLVAMWAIAGIFFGYNFGSLGTSLVFFWINAVIFAVALGIFNISIVLRYGSTIGPLTWILPFLIQPFVAVFYPVTVLPETLQRIVWFIPLTHVFEGMRYTIKTGAFNTSEFLTALFLNVAYFVFAVGLFAYIFNSVRKKGTLVKL